MSAVLKSHDHAKAMSIKLSNEDYHKHPSISNTGLNILIDQSPAHFLEWKTNPPEETPAMKTGRMVHSGILEPDLFLDTHVAMVECDRRTKVGKEYYEKFCIENEGKVIMTKKDYDQVFGMIGSVTNHPTANAILRNNHNELSFFAEIDGIKVRCRPDVLREGRLLADVKSTEDASFRFFQRSIGTYKYHRQAAIYCDVVSQVTGETYDTFTFIAVEKYPPYAVQVFVLDEASIEKGREEYRRGIEIYKRCLETGKWPAYAEEAVPMNLPSWMFEVVI